MSISKPSASGEFPKYKNNRKASTLNPVSGAGVFVGVGFDGSKNFSRLHRAVEDAVHLAHLLSVEFPLIPPSRVWMLLGGEVESDEASRQLTELLEHGAMISTADQQNLMMALSAMTEATSDQGLFVLFATSHGAVEEEGQSLVLNSPGEESNQTVLWTHILSHFQEFKTRASLILTEGCFFPSMEEMVHHIGGTGRLSAICSTMADLGDGMTAKAVSTILRRNHSQPMSLGLMVKEVERLLLESDSAPVECRSFASPAAARFMVFDSNRPNIVAQDNLSSCEISIPETPPGLMGLVEGARREFRHLITLEMMAGIEKVLNGPDTPLHLQLANRITEQLEPPLSEGRVAIFVEWWTSINAFISRPAIPITPTDTSLVKRPAVSPPPSRKPTPSPKSMPSPRQKPPTPKGPTIRLMVMILGTLAILMLIAGLFLVLLLTMDTS